MQSLTKIFIIPTVLVGLLLMSGRVFPQNPYQNYRQDPYQTHRQDPHQTYRQDPYQTHRQDPYQAYPQAYQQVPQQVAEAFINAVIIGDYARAKMYVVPEERKSFDEDLKELRELPPLPDRPRVRVRVHGDRASAFVENWNYRDHHDDGIDMFFTRGKWWIGRGH